MTNFYLDTEFYEDGKTIDLISIGIVDERGREFYAVSQEARLDLVNDWVRENVLSSLPPYSSKEWMTRKDIKENLVEFVDLGCLLPKETREASKPVFYAYYADYDWVCLSQLFGRMLNLPKHFPKFCMDLKQLSVSLGSPKHPPDPIGEHNALVDARWNRELHKFLLNYEYSQLERLDAAKNRLGRDYQQFYPADGIVKKKQ